tara:strand:+ start:12118 stop:13050 length:933 start_codon:yes stop_codon:yes gene_type:complete
MGIKSGLNHFIRRTPLKPIKQTLLLSLLLFSFTAYGKLTYKWLGISGFVLSDEKTTLVFDPAMTRVGLLDFLPFRTVKTDEDEVDYWLSRCGVKSIDAVFVNHAHTDHVIDAPYVARKFKAKLYGSSSVINVGLGQGLNNDQLQEVSDGEQWKVGAFTITAYLTPHSPHVLGITLMDGDITSPLKAPSSAWNYRAGDTYSYHITHPEGDLLFQAISRVDEEDTLKDLKADTLLLTIANRASSENLIKRFKTTGAKTVIPLHYDNFFKKMKREGEIDLFWGVDMEEFKASTSEKAAEVKIVWPGYCEGVGI